jgi:hypothetical protein
MGVAPCPLTSPDPDCQPAILLDSLAYRVLDVRYTLLGYGRWMEAGVYGYTPNKGDYLKRLRRIEGQVRGLQKMVDEDTYCIDILTQVSAATKALQSVAVDWCAR